MPACRFTIAFQGDAAALVLEAKDFAERNGGRISGDESSGRFEARIMGFSKFAGTYQIVEQTMAVAITDKPMLLSCAAIESAIRQKLNGR